MKRFHWTLLAAVLLLTTLLLAGIGAGSSGAKALLFSEGQPRFNLARYLHGHPRAVYALGACACLASLLLGRRFNRALLAGYLLFIAYMTLMYRTRVSHRLNLELFWSYRQFLSSAGMRAEILYNIWLFVPLGTILYRLIGRPWAIAVPILVSISVELAQYALRVGLCELDDVVSNGLGGALGGLLGLAWTKLTTHRKET